MPQLLTVVLCFILSLMQTSLAQSLEVLTDFNPAEGQLPEGLVIAQGVIYVGLATTQEVVTVQHGERQLYANFPSLPPGEGFLTGLYMDDNGYLYAGLASFNEAVSTGIYRVAPGESTGSLFATAPEMGFPNDFTAVSDGVLISDSMAGMIWHMSYDGAVQPWLSHPLLSGDPGVCPPDEVGFPIGANGMDIGPDGALYVAVTDRAMVLRIERQDDGRPADVKPLLASDCEHLEGADGLLANADSLVVAVNRTDQLVRLSYDGEVERLHQGNGLNFPASLARESDGVLITNFDLMRATTPGLLRWTGADE